MPTKVPPSASMRVEVAMVMKYVGGCHCGGVSYRAEVDLSAGTIRCNCTWCTKTGWWVARLPPSAFELVRQDTLKRRAGVVEVFECERCGVKVHACGDMPEMGGPFVNLNVRTLDGAHLVGASIVWLDGRNDTWAILGQTVYDAPIEPLLTEGSGPF